MIFASILYPITAERMGAFLFVAILFLYILIDQASMYLLCKVVKYYYKSFIVKAEFKVK